MKNKIFKTPAVLVFALCAIFIQGCQKTPEDIQKEIDKDNLVTEQNKESIKQPVVMGTTVDGQEIKRIHFKYKCKTSDSCYSTVDHFVYYVGNSVSDNREVRIAKSVYNNVEVSLGTKPTPEQVIAEGERIKKEIEDSERKELKRLSHKYNYDECGKSMPEFVLPENPTIEQQTYSLAYEQAQKAREACIHEHEEYEKAKKDLEAEKAKLKKES